jgi:nucleotide-binding universal stress UspA family protein
MQVREMVFIHEDPKFAIPEYVKEVDAEILAMGTVARRGIGGLFI